MWIGIALAYKHILNQDDSNISVDYITKDEA